MNSKPLVSVLMPAFNSENFIAKAIDSILAQTYCNIELIIYDDGSKDGTRRIIESYLDPRIVQIYSDQNLGVVRARNVMIERARGKYIALMDADDLSDPLRIEKQLKFLEDGSCDICGSAQWVLDEKSGTIFKSKDKFSDSDLRSLLSVYCTMCNSAVMGKSSIFKKFKYDSEVPTSEDYFLWVQIAASGYRFLNLEDRLITYRLHASQSSVVDNKRLLFFTAEVQKRYLNLLNISDSLRPRPLPVLRRLRAGVKLLQALRIQFPGISFKARAEIYARFQYPRNGILRPLIKFERYIVAITLGFL